jgi:hypothetical protein
MKQIFRALEEAPSAPPSTGLCCAGVGEKWIFSSSSCSFVYGYEAVRIRVKYLFKRFFHTKDDSSKRMKYSEFFLHILFSMH